MLNRLNFSLKYAHLDFLNSRSIVILYDTYTKGIRVIYHLSPTGSTVYINMLTRTSYQVLYYFHIVEAIACVAINSELRV